MSKDGAHRFSKLPCERIRLIEGFGVAGDAHAGVTVQHRSRVARDPSQPNLRQVHLIGAEFFALAQASGYELAAGDVGENVLTQGLDLLGLPAGTLLQLGPAAVVRVTGLRNPCLQIENFRRGLLKVATGRDQHGQIFRQAGVMSVVVAGGEIMRGDWIEIERPAGPQSPLAVV